MSNRLGRNGRIVTFGLVLAGWATAVAADSPKVELATCRPRLMLRPTEWKGGLSVDQLRQRADVSPFKERLHLLRTTRANLAMKWLIGGDEKAATDALALLKAFNPKLDTSDEGAQLVDVALAYDWLHGWSGFSADDKKRVAEQMVALAGEMEKALAADGAHVFHTRMYAWTAGMGLAGLALHDVHPAGARLFEFARNYYETRLRPARKIQGGAMHNGLSYGPNFMMFPLLQFLQAARSAAGIDYFHTADPADSDWLRETALFLIHAVQPDMRHVQYADVATQDPAKHFRFMLDMFAREYGNGQAAAMASRISERFKTSGYHAEWIYLFFALHDPAVQPRPLSDLDTFGVFSPRGVGHVFMRSGWTEDATLVHFRCGDYFENHGHFDQGSFTIFRRGGLAVKGGGYWGFDVPHRHHYYKQAISANTVIFSDPADASDEGRQRNINYQRAGTVEAYLALKKADAEPRVETGDIVAMDDPAWFTCTDKGAHHVAADVTAAWDPAKVKRYVRQLAWVDNRHLIVVDEAETTKPSIRARWLLHTPTEPRRAEAAGQDAGRPVWTVRLADSQLAVQCPLPAEPKATLIGGAGRECEVNGVNYPYLNTEKYLRYHKTDKEPKPDPASGLWRIELETPTPAARRLFVVVLTADNAGASPPAVQVERTGEGLTVRVDRTTAVFRKVAGPGG